MRAFVSVILAMALSAPLVATCTGEEHQTLPPEADGKEQIQVLDVVVISSNLFNMGTNTISLSAATNRLARHRDTIDVIAVHGPMGGDTSVETKSSAVTRLASVGIPLVLVEKEGEYAWRERADGNGVRTVKLGTDELAAFRRLWTHRKRVPAESAEPALQATIRWDTATGTYELNRVELGVFGRRVWLMHQYRETDDESGATGIQIMKEW